MLAIPILYPEFHWGYIFEKRRCAFLLKCVKVWASGNSVYYVIEVVKKILKYFHSLFHYLRRCLPK